MPAFYDGYIRIDTKINQRNAQANLNSLGTSLKKFSGIVAAAFSVQQITKFMMSCVKTSQLFTNAWIGLKSVVEGTGQSFADAQGFIQRYIKDGLIPANNAVAAYKNLLLRGYDTKQIEDMMMRLKDSATFARQGTLSMGQAVEGATEGLKNELSTLVDNAGVTKNVAQMWKDYAAQIGKTTAQLTVADKRQAEYNGIMHETRFQVGDAAKIAGTYTGQVAMLTFNITNLKNSLGTGFTAAFKPIIVWLNELITKLNIAAEVFANFTTALFGQAQTYATGATDAADAIGGITDANEEAAASAEKTKKAMAGFDKLNILDPKADTTEKEKETVKEKTTSNTTADVAKGAEDAKARIKAFFDFYRDRINELKGTWDSVGQHVSEFNDKLREQFTKANPFKSLVSAAIEFGNTVGKAIDLVIQVVGKLFIALNVPEIIKTGLDALAGLFKLVGDIVTSITPGILAFTDAVLVPMAEWIGGKLADAFRFLAEQFGVIAEWFTSHQEDFTILGEKIGAVAKALWDLIKPILDTAWKLFKDAIKAIIDILLELGDWILDNKQLVVNFLAVFTAFKAVGFIKEILSIVGTFIKLTIELGINNGQWLLLHGWMVKTTFEMGLNNIQWGIMWIKLQLANKELILANIQWAIATLRMEAALAISILLNSQIIITGLKIAIVVAGVLLLIYFVSKIQENWKNMSTVEKVVSVLGALAIAAGVAAVAFGALQSAWTLGLAAAAIVAGTVAISAALSSAKSDATSQISSSIPRLAKGGVIPPGREFMAVLGDQKSGTNIEAPMATIKQGVAEVLADMDIGGPVSVNFTGSLAQIGRVLQPVVVREDKRKGKSLVTEGNI